MTEFDKDEYPRNRLLHEKILAYESKLIGQDSLKILKEFESINEIITENNEKVNYCCSNPDYSCSLYEKTGKYPKLRSQDNQRHRKHY